MNRYARMLITDGRNPYGSRGGYVRDYANDDYRRDRNDDYYRRDRGYDDYYRMDRYQNDYNNDYYRRDYGSHKMFSSRDIKEWEKNMVNENGSVGKHFDEETCKQYLKQLDINTNEITEEIFCLTMNMVYSDYCKVAQRFGVDRPDFYAEMAKAFLKDKDFDGSPEEKLYLYYKAIVEKDE